MADALDELRPGAAAERFDELAAFVAVARGEAKLDQLVVVEGTLELGDERIARARGADAHRGIQMVGAGAQRALVLPGQWPRPWSR